MLECLVNKLQGGWTLKTLLTRFIIENVDRFWKIIDRFDKEEIQNAIAKLIYVHLCLTYKNLQLQQQKIMKIH